MVDYCSRASSSTETKEFHHPNRLGTELVTNGGAGTSYRQTTFPFGTAISAETTGNSNQVFTSYDRSAATGLDYAVNRTYSKGQSRFTQPDPIGMAAASLGNPQSLNMYAYTQNMPTDFVDPSGLYTACAHKAMTKFLAALAGFGPTVATALGDFAGDGLGGADSTKHAATGLANWVYGLFKNDGDAHTIHFPNDATLIRERANFQNYMASRNYQAAAFVLHAIQDGLGAHQGYSLPAGHAIATLSGNDPDKVLGDSKFRTAAIETFRTLTNNPGANLTSDQLSDLIDTILRVCGKDFKVDLLRPRRAPPGTVPRGSIGGGGSDFFGQGPLMIYSPGPSAMDWLWWWYGQQTHTSVRIL